MYFNSNLKEKAQQIINCLNEKAMKITVAESCSGGLIAALFTEISGSSIVFERGFVVYSNNSKHEVLGVKNEILDNFGAVSYEVAKEMALGSLKNSGADISVATTGIAGPTGATLTKPVGLVYISVAFKKGVKIRKFNFSGDRSHVRKLTIIEAVKMVESLLAQL